jgi:hypothetical protein
MDSLLTTSALNPPGQFKEQMQNLASGGGVQDAMQDFAGSGGVQDALQNFAGSGGVQDAIQNTTGISPSAIQDKIQNTIGISPSAIMSAVQNAPEIAKILEDPVGTGIRIAKNLKNSKTVGKGVKEGVEVVAAKVVENVGNKLNQAGQVFKTPLSPEENIQYLISVTVIIRNVLLVIIIIWGILMGIRKYSNVLPRKFVEVIDDTNDFFHAYSGIITLILVIGSILSTIIFILPYLSDGINFTTRIQDALNIIL